MSGYTPVAGNAFFTPDEVARLSATGGMKALKAAFQWLYGCETTSGNGQWLRRMLCERG